MAADSGQRNIAATSPLLSGAGTENPPTFVDLPGLIPPVFCKASIGRVGDVRDDELRRSLADANPLWASAASARCRSEFVVSLHHSNSKQFGNRRLETPSHLIAFGYARGL